MSLPNRSDLRKRAAMRLRLQKPALALLREAALSRQTFVPYLSIDDVAYWLATRKKEVARSTLRSYMSDLVREGLFRDAGRGWYCRHEGRPVFDDSSVRALDEVRTAFPFLGKSIWSTSMVNPWLHHLVGTDHKFLHVERDGLEPVADYLETAGWKVSLNPNASSSSRLSPGEKTVIVRPLHVHAPMTDGSMDLLPERLLVDLRIEVGRLGVMGLGEYHAMAYRLASEAHLVVAPLLSYGKFRGLSLHDLFGNRSSSLFSKNEIDRSGASK